MLIFPECLEGLQVFGEQVLPRMRTAKLVPLRPPRRNSVPLMAWPRGMPMNGTSSKHFGLIREAALASLGEAYSAEDVHYELAFADAEEHRLSIGRFLMGSDYDAVPRQAILEGFDPYASAGRIVLPLVHKHFLLRRHM
jgi:hypothetical protein